MFKLFLKVTTYNDAVRMLIEMATCKRRAEAEVCPFWTGIATSAPQQKPCRNRYGDEGCRHSQIYSHTGLHTDLDTCVTSKCIVDVDSNKNRPYISLHATRLCTYEHYEENCNVTLYTANIKSRFYFQNMTQGGYMFCQTVNILTDALKPTRYLSNFDSFQAFCAQDLHPMQHRSFALM